MFDLNADEIIDREINQQEYLREPAKGLRLLVFEIRQMKKGEETLAFDKGVKLVYQIMEGIHAGKLITENIEKTQTQAWKLRRVFVACGLYTTEERPDKDGEFKLAKLIPKNDQGEYDEKMLLNHDFMADYDYYKSKSDGKDYLTLMNERELKA